MYSKELDDIIERYKTNNVYFCQFFGVRSTYGLLPDYSEKTITHRIYELKIDIETILNLQSEEKRELQSFELNLVLYGLKSELFSLEVVKPHKKSINVYAEPISNIITVYASRSYAPIDERIKDIISHEKAIPDFLNNGVNILDKDIPKSILKMGLSILNGVNSFLGTDLEKIIDLSNNLQLKEEWREINKIAIESISNFIDILKKDFLPNCADKFSLGEEQFLQLLEAAEGIKVTTKQLLTIAEKDLESNFKMLKKFLKKEKSEIFDEMSKDYPEPENLIVECQKIVNDTKNYLKESNLLTLPTDEDCEVVETPEFRRSFSIASMNLPGLAESSEGKETYYYITTPDKSWTDDQKIGFMKNFARGNLHVTTIHEVFPGHFVQGLYYQNVITSPIIRLFSFSISILEGWAHYGEELIVNHGYNKYDRTKIQIGQLLGALKRNVRFLCAIKMHCMDMTVEEAKRIFKEKAFLSEEGAQMEAMRGTVDPLYLNYTIGKLFIKKLKADYKKEHGKNFNEKEFHDSILKLGAPPILLLRQALLKKTPIEEFL